MKKILIIDDEKNVVENIAGILHFEGFSVKCSLDGLDGINAAQRERPDIILCDIQMPELDGYEVLKKLKENHALCDIPFIFLTARTEKSDYRAGMELGADDYLTKPFSRDELLNAINSRLVSHEQKKQRYRQSLDELRSSISYSMPHEYFTPLSIIIGNIELLEQMLDSLNKTEVFEIINEIKTAARRLHRLLENMRLYAELELLHSNEKKKKNVIKLEAISMKKIITDLTASFKQDSERGSDILVNAEDAFVYVDEKYLSKAIFEVINNAISFSASCTKINIVANVVRNEYILRIKDAGRGMTLEQISKVGAYMQFERKFYEQQGFGLGLTLAKKIIELFSGKLIIESEYGKSTTITFSIPLA